MLYAIRPLGERWAIIDVRTGDIIRFNEELQVGLSVYEALDVVELLSQIEAGKPARLN